MWLRNRNLRERKYGGAKPRGKRGGGERRASGHLSLESSDSAVREASGKPPDVLKHCKEPHL
ncbi:hypothetical protein SSP531S_48090 [Streptomyces spongiicola]|uniref:Uncharacterized protein n=1 Tax=Streptomyces spongiicola TaxID=1690221 RepID=A0A388T329_9ACTN|nr:hypothetical protein SSP531S_48090 [Streptomyces spongiicola]